MRIRPEIIAVLALAAAIPTALGQSNHRKDDAKAPQLNVVELFTSQGCSSCPPADALFRTYVDRPNVMALSLPVDYWDHLGWKDTLASPKHSYRQRAYAKLLGTGNVYTPQMVVNGAAQAVGSKFAAIEKAIARTARDAAIAVPVVAVNDGTRMIIEVGEPERLGDATSGTVWLVRLQPKVDVEIKRGENRGKTIAYLNVVREITPVGMWSGKAMRIELPSSAVTVTGHRCAVVLQAGEMGLVLGAAWMTP